MYRKVSENRVLAGRISKRWGGYAQEWLSNADTYAITFPLEMEAKLKALLIIAAILIVRILYSKYNYFIVEVFNTFNIILNKV